MGAELAHGRPAERDLPVSTGKAPADHGEHRLAPQGSCGHRRQAQLVDGDLRDDPLGDPGDSPVVFKAPKESRVNLSS